MNPKRLGFQAFDVHFGTFNYEFHVAVGPVANLKKYVRWKMDDPEWDDDLSHSLGATFRNGGKPPIMWMPRKPRTVDEFGTLAHESLHIVHGMLLWAGMKLTSDSEEAYACALTFCVTEILTKLK
jgi:hypothetical protein